MNVSNRYTRIESGVVLQPGLVHSPSPADSHADRRHASEEAASQVRFQAARGSGQGTCRRHGRGRPIAVTGWRPVTTLTAEFPASRREVLHTHAPFGTRRIGSKRLGPDTDGDPRRIRLLTQPVAFAPVARPKGFDEIYTHEIELGLSCNHLLRYFEEMFTAWLNGSRALAIHALCPARIASSEPRLPSAVFGPVLRPP